MPKILYDQGSEVSVNSWKTWAKAGLIFTGTIGGFLAVKATGNFNLVSLWLKRFKEQHFISRNLLQVSSSSSSEFNAPPILVNNELNIKVGETKVLTSTELSAIDIDTDNNTLIFTASGVQHGEFSYANGTTTLSWIQEQLGAGNIRFTHDGSFIAPTYLIKVSDGIDDIEGNRPKVSFIAENVPVTDEFQVNTYTIANNIYSSIASFSDGPFVITWMSNSTWPVNYNTIHVQLFNIDSSKSGLEFYAGTSTENYHYNPSVASFSDGRFVITWTSNGQDGDNSGVYAQLFNIDGSESGPEFQVNTYTINSQNYPSVASLEDGRFVVAWQSYGQDGDNSGVYAQLFNIDGSESGPEFQVNTYTINSQNYPSVASLEDGRFVVTWTSSWQDGNYDGIFGQIFNMDGSKNGSEFQVNTYTISFQNYPSVASFGDGRFVVTWGSYNEDGDGYGIYGQIFNVDGSKSAQEFQVNTYTISSQYDPSVASFSDGRFVVTWDSYDQDGDEYGIYGQIFNVDGSKSAQEFQVNTYTWYSQINPSITSSCDGRFVVIWQSFNQDGYASGIYGRIFVSDTCPLLTDNYLTINEDEIVILNTTNFNITDSDSDYNSILYTFTDIQHGQFELVSTPGVTITNCTQQQISVGEVLFIHDGGEQAPACKVSIGDNSLSTSFIPVEINFSANVNDMPVLEHNSLSIDEAETVVLTANDLSATDDDNDDNTLEFTVSNVQHGQFELITNLEIPISSFIQQQIVLGQVNFVHDGEEIAPSYDVVVSDGELTTTPNSTLITFTNINDMPILMNNTLTITNGQVVVLSEANLSATDIDNDDNTLQFIISNIQHGQFELLVRPDIPITLFTQQQIINGEVCFIHDGSQQSSSYQISVSDGELSTSPTLANIYFEDIISSIKSSIQISSSDTISISEKSSPSIIQLSSKSSSQSTKSSPIIQSSSSNIPLESSSSEQHDANIVPGLVAGLLTSLLVCGGGITGAVAYWWYRKHQYQCRDEVALEETTAAEQSRKKRISMMTKDGTLNMSLLIPYQNLTLQQKIGGGGSGVVWKGRWQNTDVAIKQLPLVELDISAEREFIRETSLMAKLRHPNIVSFFGVCLEPECLIIMEYMSGGSLFELLQSNIPLSWIERWKIALDVGQGLVYLHTENVMHRDLKSLNVLLDKDKRAKLTDFGLSKVDAQTIATMTRGGLGTPRWLPPEVIETGEAGEIVQSYSKKSDVYSYGIILWELATRELPFNDTDNEFMVMSKIKMGERPKDPVNCTVTYRDLMRRCWAERPEVRPEAN